MLATMIKIVNEYKVLCYFLKNVKFSTEIVNTYLQLLTKLCLYDSFQSCSFNSLYSLLAFFSSTT